MGVSSHSGPAAVATAVFETIVYLFSLYICIVVFVVIVSYMYMSFLSGN
jgi:hypothetical protein